MGSRFQFRSAIIYHRSDETATRHREGGISRWFRVAPSCFPCRFDANKWQTLATTSAILFILGNQHSSEYPPSFPGIKSFCFPYLLHRRPPKSVFPTHYTVIRNTDWDDRWNAAKWCLGSSQRAPAWNTQRYLLHAVELELARISATQISLIFERKTSWRFCMNFYDR